MAPPPFETTVAAPLMFNLRESVNAERGRGANALARVPSEAAKVGNATQLQAKRQVEGEFIQHGQEQ